MRSRLETLALVALAAAPLGAQGISGGRCSMELVPRDSSRSNAAKQPSGAYNTFYGGGFTAVCAAQKMTLVADSAEYFGDTKVLHLIGNVHYTEPRVAMNSETLTYFQLEEHLRAEGRVEATLPTGTRMTGPIADYYRVIPKTRPVALMVATNRPTISIVQPDSTGRAAEPVLVVANTVTMRGDSLVFAGGRVDITRTDLITHSDSAMVDSNREFARLMRNPTIEGRGARPFTLSGMVIDLFAHNRLLERVLSSGSAKAVSEDVTLTADTLDFRMKDRLMQQGYAWGKYRAHAVSPSYDIVADSLDVQMPGQRMREVHALRKAFAQSVADTAKITTKQRDWIRGDTILAYFDTSKAARGDTTKQQPRIRRLVAIGHADSFYQFATKDKQKLPAINYVGGRRIVATFADQQVQTVTVTDQDKVISGVFIEPTSPADSIKARARTPIGVPGRRRP